MESEKEIDLFLNKYVEERFREKAKKELKKIFFPESDEFNIGNGFIIAEIVSKRYNISLQQLQSKKRTKFLVTARKEAAEILRDKGLSLEWIGHILGNRNHSTISNLLNK